MKRPYTRGNNEDRKRRRAFVWEQNKIAGSVRCHFCVMVIPTIKALCVVRRDPRKRFTRDNLVAACGSCARSSTAKEISLSG